MGQDYHINIYYSEEDQGYIADIPDLKFCSACGDTPQEALEELLIAKQAWLEVAQSTGKPIPVAKYKNFLAERAKKGSWENFQNVLSKVSDREPETWDRI